MQIPKHSEVGGAEGKAAEQVPVLGRRPAGERGEIIEELRAGHALEHAELTRDDPQPDPIDALEGLPEQPAPAALGTDETEQAADGRCLARAAARTTS